MRVLGLDVGEARIGVAVSDSLGLTAQQLTVIPRKGLAADLAALRTLIDAQGVGTVVVGLPLTMRGERGIQAQRIASFGDALKRQVPVTVTFLDERLTTVQGERALLETGASRRKRKQVIDQVAAQLILQQFLDAKRHPAP